MSKPIQSISQGNYILATQQEVSHDNSLSGNGTTASPLGVVNGYNETVLYSGNLTGNGSTAQLSESIQNFEKIKVYGHTDDGVAYPIYSEGIVFQDNPLYVGIASNNNGWAKWFYLTIDGTTLTTVSSRVLTMGTTTWTTVDPWGVTQVVGINRK